MTTSLKSKVDEEIKDALKIMHDEKLKLTDYKQQNTDRRENKPKVIKMELHTGIQAAGFKLKVGTNCAIAD